MKLKKISDSLFNDSKQTPIRGLSAISEAERYLQQAYEGRYFFELIQNVRDANKEINQDGEIYIELKNNILSISNTGAEFSAKGIEGITTIGESTKQSQDYIGFKGIGFKSIQDITKSPRIITRYGSVYFDKKLTLEKYGDVALKKEKTPLFYFPHFVERELSGSELEKGFVTKIELPIKDNIIEDDIIHAFSEIQPKQLILLGNIKKLYFKSEKAKTKFLINKNAKKHLIEVQENDNPIIKYKYFIPKKKIVIPEKLILLLDDKEQEVFKSGSSVDINIVIELTQDSHIETMNDAKLYLFYPLQISSGFRFIIHSYFIVNPERTALRDSRVNDFLLLEIGKFIGSEMLTALKKNKANITNILCFKRNDDAKINILYDSLVSELKNKKFIYDNQTKKYFQATDIIVANGVDKGLFPDGKLAGKQLLYTNDQEVITWLQNEFNVAYLTHKDIENEIEKECKRQAKQKNIKFFQNLYNYVGKQEQLNLTGKKVLLTSSWKLVSSEEDVFYGGGKRKPLDLASSIKKHIHFIHKEIKITDLREERSQTGIREFNTHELVKRLLNLFNKVSVPNVDLLHALYNLYPLDSKSELEIKEKIILPIKGSEKWLSPLYNPIYFETENIKELYIDASFIDIEIFKDTKFEKTQSSKKDFLKTFGVWEVPAIYISKSERTKGKESREKLIMNFSGLSSRPFDLESDRILDIPAKYNNWFTKSILDNWNIYRSFITSKLIPKLKFNSQGSYGRTCSDEQAILISGFIETLRNERWICFSGEEESFTINEVVGLNVLDFSQSHNQVIGRYLKLLPIDYSSKKELLDVIGLIHFDGDSINNFRNLITFVYEKYKSNIPEGQDFIGFYNRILGKLFDFYHMNNRRDSIEGLKDQYFLSIDDITKKRYWEQANQIFYIDDKVNYDILPVPIKEKLQPHFTKRDKNTFGKIAGKIGRRFSNSIQKELIEFKVIQTETLPNHFVYLPECIALLESSSDIIINEYFERIAQIRVFVCTKLEVKISVDNSQELIIPVNHFVDLESNLDIHLSKLNSSSQNKQRAEALNDFFVNLLSRDLGHFKSDVRHFLNSSEKNNFLKDYDILNERVDEIRNKLNISYLTPDQKFWMAILDAKEISDRENIFIKEIINIQTLSESLNIEMDLINDIESNFDFHNTSNQKNITLLINVLNELLLPLEKLNEIIFPKIDFRNYYEKKINMLKNNFEKEFEFIMYTYLVSQNIKTRLNYQNYLDLYKIDFDLQIALNTLDLDVESFFIEKLNNQFNFLSIKNADLLKEHTEFNSVQVFNANFKIFKSKLESIKYTKNDLESFLSLNKNRSLLYFDNIDYLVKSLTEWLIQNTKQGKVETGEDLAGILKEFSGKGNNDIEIVETGQVEVSTSNITGSQTGGRGRRFDGGSGDQNKKLIGLIAEMVVFEQLNLNFNYKNVVWASKYASEIPEDHIGYNPEGQDGLGYDIEYLDTDGNKFYVEVKGKSDDYELFEITKTELKTAYKEGQYFKIIFVSNVMDNSKRRIQDLGNIFILDQGEDFFSNRRFTAIYKNFEIRFQEQ